MGHTESTMNEEKCGWNLFGYSGWYQSSTLLEIFRVQSMLRHNEDFHGPGYHGGEQLV